ncbi:MAG: Eco57I restriction-modification methylase domain-containing protein [Thermodesulfovibrionales bacterium]
MAGLFTPATGNDCRLLDPGAGIGSLSSAFLERCAAGELNFDTIEATAFELDERLHGEIEHTLAEYTSRLPFSFKISGSDFIEEAVNRIQFLHGNSFTHAILNPPYKKINSGSRARLLLRQVGIETVNLYSAFIALSLALLSRGGQMVAIIPRSFCNGPYYKPFRKFILNYAAIRHIHLFEARNKAFKDDKVLQENIIIMFERNAEQGDVTVTTSRDDSFADLSQHLYPFDRIIFQDDPDRLIHIPTSPERNLIESTAAIRYSLEKIGISVSTGPVVDFRLKQYLRMMPEAGAVPLLYPGHFTGLKTEWPKKNSKKPNAFHRSEDSRKWLFPKGFYLVVRRFSSKEERRRITATVVQPDDFPGYDELGFENHLNVFHENKHGLPEALAWGLAVYLNTTAVDLNFRRFSGHTQVNATDLRLMKYPSRKVLTALGEWAMRHGELTQAMIDQQLKGLAE